MNDKVQFETNVWQELRLKFSTGRQIWAQSKFTNEQQESYLFTTTDDRVMFLPPLAAARIHALKVAPGTRLKIRKAQRGRQIEWEVQRLGEQPDGTFAVEKLPGTALEHQLRASIEYVRERKENGAGVQGPLQAPPAPGTSPASEESRNANTVPNGSRPKTKLEDALCTAIHACHTANDVADIDIIIARGQVGAGAIAKGRVVAAGIVEKRYVTTGCIAIAGA